MRLITNLVKFGVKGTDLVNIFIAYIRSKLEYCCTVWHSSITLEQTKDIERVQKVCCRTILQDFDISYKEALRKLKLVKLSERRETLCLNFALKCTKNESNKDMFPLNTINYQYKLREIPKYQEKFQVPYMDKEILQFLT